MDGEWAKLAWLIDPQLKGETIYRAGRHTERLEEPGVVVGDGPVAGLELLMARIWK